MRKLSLIALTLGLTFVTHAAAVFAELRAAYVVIVNPANPVTVLDRRFVEEAFLKKTTRWPNEQVIRPVDLWSNSPIRRQFNEDILKRPIEAVKGYWQQRIFSGRDVPPPELNSDDEVVKYVLQYDGAIGYVSVGADLNGAKILVVE